MDENFDVTAALQTGVIVTMSKHVTKQARAHVGALLREAREAAGLKQKALADLMGVRSPTLSHIERGSSRLTGELYGLLRKHLPGCPAVSVVAGAMLHIKPDRSGRRTHKPRVIGRDAELEMPLLGGAPAEKSPALLEADRMLVTDPQWTSHAGPRKRGWVPAESRVVRVEPLWDRGDMGSPPIEGVQLVTVEVQSASPIGLKIDAFVWQD